MNRYFEKALDILNEEYSFYSNVNRKDQFLLDLSAGQVEISFPNEIKDLLLAGRNAFAFNYVDPQGTTELRVAYLDFLQSMNVSIGNVGIENILVTNGAKEALWLVFNLVINKKSKVMVPKPCWSPYKIWIKSIGAEIYDYDVEITERNRFLNQIEFFIKSSDISHFILNYPNNPTGLAIDQSTLNDLIDLCALYDVEIISDEIYRGFGANISILNHGSLKKKNCIDSISKAFGLAGLRIGFLIAEEDLVQKALGIKSLVNSCTNSFGQAVTCNLMNSKLMPTWLESINKTIKNNNGIIRSYLSKNGVHVQSEGGLYMWLINQKDSVKFDIQSKFSTTSGRLFGLPNGTRLCTARDTSKINEALDAS